MFRRVLDGSRYPCQSVWRWVGFLNDRWRHSFHIGRYRFRKIYQALIRSTLEVFIFKILVYIRVHLHFFDHEISVDLREYHQKYIQLVIELLQWIGSLSHNLQDLCIYVRFYISQVVIARCLPKQTQLVLKLTMAHIPTRTTTNWHHGVWQILLNLWFVSQNWAIKLHASWSSVIKVPRWWFQLFLSNNLYPDPWGFMIQFDLRIQMGWGNNHQLIPINLRIPFGKIGVHLREALGKQPPT